MIDFKRILSVLHIAWISSCVVVCFSAQFSNRYGYHVSSQNGRLPTSLEADHYILELRPDIYSGAPPFHFEGHVEVFFYCRQPTNQIVLNSRDLAIGEVTSLNATVGVVSWGLDVPNDFLQIQMSDTMVEGLRYGIRVTFNGTMRSYIQGDALYYDSYQQDGQTRYLVASQLHAHEARRVFPSFDEPAMKATVDVILLRHSTMTSLSNGQLDRSEIREGDWVADYFETSPRMSVYLLAFAIMDFPHLETITSRGYVLRVWAREEMLQGAQYALSVAEPIMHWFEDYTQQPYQIPKIDHIALPSKAGAMENWGLVTYSERNLLWDEDWFDSTNMRGTAGVIAHELAHMWFGNLVTMQWWEDTWLSEGFATYFEASPLNDVLGWTNREYELDRRVLPQLATDGQNIAPAVRMSIDTPWQALQSFTSSQYSKGASVIRMLSQVLGPTTLQKGLQRYLAIFAHSNAKTDDLWDALTQQAAEDGVTDVDGSPLIIKDKFDTWVDQRGFPLVQVTWDYVTGVVNLTQGHYNPHGQALPPSPFDYKWNVAVTLATKDEPGVPLGTDVWMDRETSVVVDNVSQSADGWVLANVGASGFYRVLYDQHNFDNIVNQLTAQHQIIDVESRTALINNAFELASTGYLSVVDAFKTTQYLAVETETLPWLWANKALEYPVQMLQRFNSTKELLDTYLRRLVDPLYQYKGWDNTGDEDVYQLLLRQLAIREACTLKNSLCLTTARGLFDQWLSKPQPNPIAVDQRPAVYCSSLKDGTQSEWNTVHQRYINASPMNLPHVADEARVLRTSLSCSADADILQSYLGMLFDPDQIPWTDTGSAMLELSRSEHGRWVVWNHLRDNWRENPVPSGINKGNVLLTVVEGFASPEDETMFNEFLWAYPAEDEAEEETYTRASSIVSTNRAWAQQNLQPLHNWLNSVLYP